MAVAKLSIKSAILLTSLLFVVEISMRMFAHAQNAKMLAFEVWSGVRQDTDIFIADVDHRITVNLTRNPSWGDIAPTWSPDNHLAYIASIIDHSEVMLFDFSMMRSTSVSQSRRAITLDVPAWSPSGELAFIGYDAQGAFTTVYVVDGTDNPLGDATPQTRFDDRSVGWFSNREIVFVTPRESAGIDLVMLDLDTGFKTLIASDELMNLVPVVSPSDNAVIYHAYSPTVRSDLTLFVYLWREGQPARRLFSFLPPTSDYLYTQSFVNGAAAFTGKLNGIHDVFLWHMSDDSLLNISNSPASESEAALSEDGRSAFVDDANSRQNIRVYDPQTGQITLIYSADQRITNLAWSH